MSRTLDCLVNSRSEAQPSISRGLIMVKPHATELGLDHVVESILRDEGNFACGEADDMLQATIKRVEVHSVMPRNLHRIRHGEEVINLFYGDKTNRRYFPLILEWYMGKAIFLDFVVSPVDADSFTADMDALKGTTRTYDLSGKELDPDSGIRGVIGSAYVAYDKDTLDNMDDMSYRGAIEPVIQNYIHVCDKPGEAEQALDLIS